MLLPVHLCGDHTPFRPNLPLSSRSKHKGWRGCVCVSRRVLFCVCVLCVERERERGRKDMEKKSRLLAFYGLSLSLSSSEMLDAAAGYK